MVSTGSMSSLEAGSANTFLTCFIGFKFPLDFVFSLTSSTLVSSIFESDALLETNQRNFYNIVTEIEYSRTSSDLLNEVKEIEDFLGRKKTYRYGPRLIDIDIIFFNNENNSSKELTIPHYDWRNRLFVVEPLCEIINVFDIADFNLNDQKVEKKGSISYK